MIVPLFVGRQRSVSAAAEAYQFGQELILTAQKSADIAEPEPSDLYDVAVAAKIEDFFKIGDGSIKVVVQGLRRVNIKKVVVLDRFYGAETEDLLDNSRCFTEALHLMQSLKDMLTSPGTKKIPQEMLCNLLKIQDPELFADTISSLLSLDTVQKQILLELIDPSARLIQLLDIFESEMKVHKHDENVPGVLNDQDPVSRNEYYLEEQLKTIKKDLGNHDEIESETDELKSRIQKAKLPPHVNRRANRELKRLEQMPPMSAEGSVLRHYLEWLIDTPWESRAKE
ncbi:MAG: LON peptidase substrate-binding domain-containing protein, partial [Nitrospinota bacterium]